MREACCGCGSSFRIQVLRPCASCSRLTSGRSRCTSGNIKRPASSGSTLMVSSADSALNRYFSFAQAGLANETRSARIRGCTQLQTGLRSPSISSSRPALSALIREIGPRSPFSPMKATAMPAAMISSRNTPAVHFTIRIGLRFPQTTCPLAANYVPLLPLPQVRPVAPGGSALWRAILGTTRGRSPRAAPRWTRRACGAPRCAPRRARSAARRSACRRN